MQAEAQAPVSAFGYHCGSGAVADCETDSSASLRFPHIALRGQRLQIGQYMNDPSAWAKSRSNAPGWEDLTPSDRWLVALSARLSTLREAMTRILRDNAGLAEQLKATQTQMAQDNASVAEQLKALTEMMSRRSGILAMGSEEQERGQVTIGSTATAPAAARSQTAHRKNRASHAWFTDPAWYLARGIYFGKATRH
jgi:hypothetical protein